MYLPRIDADIKMTTRDGVTLTGDLYRPADEGRWPVLLHRTPYDRRDSYRVSGLVADPVWLARQGFAVFVQDTRGRAESGGELDFVKQEYNDSYDVIDWIAEQPWSDGNVGIYGASYLGMTGLQAVAARNSHLKAAVAMVATVDMRHTTRPGGPFELGFLTTYAVAISEDGLEHTSLTAAEREHARKQLREAAADRRAVVSQLPLTGIAPLNDSRVAPFWTDWLRSPHDAFWDRPNLLTEPDRVTIPLLQICGYHDFTSPTQFRLAARLADNEQARLIAGPWTHYGTYSASGQSGARVLPNANGGVLTWSPVLAAFFDRHLRGGDGADYPSAAPYLSGPEPVTYFVGGANTWAHAPTWPPAGAVEDWALISAGDARTAGGDGLLTRAGEAGTSTADTFVADPRDPFPTHGGAALFEGEPAAVPAGIQDQRVVDGRSDLLVYTSAPLTEDVTIAGQPELIAFVTSTAPDADLCVTLVDVEPDGYALNVAEGAQRARYRDGGDSDWLSPDEPSRVTVTLNDVAHRFVRGHRIRVQIAGFSFPRYSRNLHTRTVPEFGTLDEAVTARHTIHHDGSTPSALRLPTITT